MALLVQKGEWCGAVRAGDVQAGRPGASSLRPLLAEPKSGNENISLFQEGLVIWGKHRTLGEVPHFPPANGHYRKELPDTVIGQGPCPFRKQG